MPTIKECVLHSEELSVKEKEVDNYVTYGMCVNCMTNLADDPRFENVLVAAARTKAEKILTHLIDNETQIVGGQNGEI